MSEPEDLEKFVSKNLNIKDVSMDECQKEKNLTHCNCSYDPCSRKGVCCECLQYHWRMEQLPACLFPDDAERTYDRSLRHFISIYKDRV